MTVASWPHAYDIIPGGPYSVSVEVLMCVFDIQNGRGFCIESGRCTQVMGCKMLVIHSSIGGRLFVFYIDWIHLHSFK